MVMSPCCKIEMSFFELPRRWFRQRYAIRSAVRGRLQDLLAASNDRQEKPGHFLYLLSASRLPDFWLKLTEFLTQEALQDSAQPQSIVPNKSCRINNFPTYGDALN